MVINDLDDYSDHNLFANTPLSYINKLSLAWAHVSLNAQI